MEKTLNLVNESKLAKISGGSDFGDGVLNGVKDTYVAIYDTFVNGPVAAATGRDCDDDYDRGDALGHVLALTSIIGTAMAIGTGVGAGTVLAASKGKKIVKFFKKKIARK